MSNPDRSRRSRVWRILITAASAVGVSVGLSALSLSPASAQTPPTATNHRYNIESAVDNVLSLPAPGVLPNDKGAGLQATGLRAIQAPAEYSLSWAPDGSFEVALSQNGEHVFEYTVVDTDGETDVAQVTVSMTADDPPGVVASDLVVADAYDVYLKEARATLPPTEPCDDETVVTITVAQDRHNERTTMVT